MQLTWKLVKKVIATYALERTVLENVDRIKYLGVTIINDLRWNTHVGNICIKANRTLGFLKCNLSSCPRKVKEMAYKRLVRTNSRVCKSSLGSFTSGRIGKSAELSS